MSTEDEKEVEGTDTPLGRLSLRKTMGRWVTYLGTQEMCCGDEPFARCWYGAADVVQTMMVHHARDASVADFEKRREAARAEFEATKAKMHG